MAAAPDRPSARVDGRRAERRQRVQRDDPRRDRRREVLREKRPERLVLPALDVARRPVVHEADARRGARPPARSGSARRARCPGRRRRRLRARSRGAATARRSGGALASSRVCPLGRRIGVPLTTIDDARRDTRSARTCSSAAAGCRDGTCSRRSSRGGSTRRSRCSRRSSHGQQQLGVRHRDRDLATRDARRRVLPSRSTSHERAHAARAAPPGRAPSSG